MSDVIPAEAIRNKIFLIRGQKVMVDRDLAELYQTETRILNQAVKRNIDRFPEDFMFQLTGEEYKALMSQFVISNRGGTRKMPYAFTEHGVLMLANVLNSEIAVQMSIKIIRVFAGMRELIQDNSAIFKKIEDVEQIIEENILNRLDMKDTEIKQIWITLDFLKKEFGQLKYGKAEKN
jgi:hypothetical protein